MKTIRLLLLLSFFLTVFSNHAQSQNKDITLGVGIGINRGVNEAKTEDRIWSPAYGVFGLFRNVIGRGITPEISFMYYSNQTKDGSDFANYKTSMIAPDLRVRYYPLNLNHWAPYIYMGLGALSYDVEIQPTDPSNYPQPDPESELTGTALYFPFGAGISHFFNESIGMDLNIGYNASTTDNLNPIYDDVPDGNWMAKISILLKVREFDTDSDGDGLFDKEEAKFGTDPNNPDTDKDGLLDGEEVNKYETDPLDKDSDDGGIGDGIEVRNGVDPLDADDDILSIAPGKKLILRNLEFATGKSDITSKSKRILNFALRAFNSAVAMEVEIVGHTDDTGDTEDNLALSTARAESVRAWFIGKGIDPGRLRARGAGQSEPMLPNTSDKNRQTNRRVEFIRTK